MDLTSQIHSSNKVRLLSLALSPHTCALTASPLRYAAVWERIRPYLMSSTEEITPTSENLKQGKLEAKTEMKPD